MRLALLVRPLQLLARALTLVVFTGARGVGQLIGRCVSAGSRLAAAPDGGAAAAASLPVAMRWLSFFTHPVFGTPLAAVAVSWLARSARRSLAQSWRAQPAVSPQGKGGALGRRIRVTLARFQPEPTARGWRTELAAGSEMHHIVQKAYNSTRRRNGNSSAAEGQLERAEALKGSHPFPFGTPEPTINASTPLHEVRGVRSALHESPSASGARADLALTAAAIFLFFGASSASTSRHSPLRSSRARHTHLSRLVTASTSAAPTAPRR
ncbi:hypothetical protein AB1Y20_016340 [Prymnesium parvum]|uniref:Uncharacterized protein n=1 Tax=Prymnesium parvum TaxID=97485 RepID=A0AB34IFY0_PRYPA